MRIGPRTAGVVLLLLSLLMLSSSTSSHRSMQRPLSSSSCLSRVTGAAFLSRPPCPRYSSSSTSSSPTTITTTGRFRVQQQQPNPQWCPSMYPLRHHHHVLYSTAVSSFDAFQDGDGIINPPPPAAVATTPAVDDDGAATTTPLSSPSSSMPVPSLSTLLKFTLPTLAIWLTGPIMSLVDTSVVGLQSSLELASMGPATNVCDSMLYVFTFLAVATTNLLAEALAKDDKEESQRVVSQALTIALTAGAVVMGVIRVYGPSLLAKTISAEGGGYMLIPACLKYTSVRALGGPAVLVSMVAQAALLGAKDSVTPLVVTLFAGLINFVGDVVLVAVWHTGVQGAAMATVAAEYVGTAVLLRTLYRFQGNKRYYPFMSVPSLPDLAKFFVFAGPIFGALLGKTLCYSAMGVAAQQCGTVQLAAHQVMLRVFFFFTPFGDALSTTAQAFLPGLLSRGNKLAVSKVMRRILLISLGVGGANAFLAGLIPYFFPGLFTTSAAIATQMQDLSRLLSYSLVAHACTMALEGILLAQRELAYLATCYAVNTAMVIVALTMLGGRTIAISSVWGTLLGFQVIRLCEFGVKLALKHRVGDKIKGWWARRRRRRTPGGDEVVVEIEEEDSGGDDDGNDSSSNDDSSWDQQ